MTSIFKEKLKFYEIAFENLLTHVLIILLNVITIKFGFQKKGY